MCPYITDPLLACQIILRHTLHGDGRTFEMFDLSPVGISALRFGVKTDKAQYGGHNKHIDNDDKSELTLKERENFEKYINKFGKKDKDIKERIVIQYNNYKNYLDSFVEKYNIKIDDLDKKVAELVNYRHKHTHNDVGILTQELVNTTYIVQALIYCMILKKVGLNEDNINYTLTHCIC